MNEAEYLMKNYGDRGVCYPSRPRRITPSENSIIFHMIRKPNSIIVFTAKTTQPRPQVFSVNGALTCKKAALVKSSVD